MRMRPKGTDQTKTMNHSIDIDVETDLREGSWRIPSRRLVDIMSSRRRTGYLVDIDSTSGRDDVYWGVY